MAIIPHNTIQSLQVNDDAWARIIADAGELIGDEDVFDAKDGASSGSGSKHSEDELTPGPVQGDDSQAGAVEVKGRCRGSTCPDAHWVVVPKDVLEWLIVIGGTPPPL